MNKAAIKIIKRNKKDPAEKARDVAVAPKIKSEKRPTIVKAIENWISERRENSRTEKVFSDEKIPDWESMSEDFK